MCLDCKSNAMYIYNANNAANKANSKHTKKQAPCLRDTIINMWACAGDKKIIWHLPYLLWSAVFNCYKEQVQK